MYVTDVLLNAITLLGDDALRPAALPKKNPKSLKVVFGADEPAPVVESVADADQLKSVAVASSEATSELLTE